MKSVKSDWNGKIKHIKRDLTGYNGFKSEKEFFYVLNSVTNYAFIENLSKRNNLYVLTDNPTNMQYIIHEDPLHRDKTKQYATKVGNKNININIISYKKNILCDEMIKKTLKKRKFKNGKYVIKQKDLYKKCLFNDKLK